jgi:squalene cyclase
MYFVKLLAVCLLLAPITAVRAQPEPIAIRAAAMRSLKLLESSAAKYTEHRQCFSCHHQALPTLAFTTAKARGFDIDEKALAHQLKFTVDFLTKNRANYLKGKGQGGQADTAGYALFALHAGGWNADETTAAVVEYLLRRDTERGYWQVTSQRPPTEASSFTTTYLALAGLKHFGVDEKKQDIEARFEKTRDWLLKTKPKDTEDRVFRLRALKLSGTDDQAIKTAADELVKAQRNDGGWSQIDTLDSDAYATGTVLTALHQVGGMKTNDKVYGRGVQFLLDTQKDDGSWFIRSRSKPFQLYFESGFPHTKDQWISCAGTSWATVALTLACDGR